MKYILIGTLGIFSFAPQVWAQDSGPAEDMNKPIILLVDTYSRAREQGDTLLLKSILTSDIDQLVSTGEWRMGMAEAVEGMRKSSAATPGRRTLKVDKIKMITPVTAIADCIYEIENIGRPARKMWSSFVVLFENGSWKINAIRNMLPAVDK